MTVDYGLRWDYGDYGITVTVHSLGITVTVHSFPSLPSVSIEPCRTYTASNPQRPAFEQWELNYCEEEAGLLRCRYPSDQVTRA